MDPERAAAPGGAVLPAAGGFGPRVGTGVVPGGCSGFPACAGVRTGVVAMEPVEDTRRPRPFTTRRPPAAVRLAEPAVWRPEPPRLAGRARPLKRAPVARRVARDGGRSSAVARVDTRAPARAASEAGRCEGARAAAAAPGAGRGVRAVYARPVPRRGAVPLAPAWPLGAPGSVVVAARVRAPRVDKALRMGAQERPADVTVVPRPPFWVRTGSVSVGRLQPAAQRTAGVCVASAARAWAWVIW